MTESEVVETEDYDGDDIIGPTNWDFKDWWGAGEAYALNAFPDWHPEMIRKFASDIAWQCEGWTLTPSKMAEAAEDWFSGSNPYSPHCVPTDGYDYIRWGQRERVKSEVLLNEYGVAQGMDVKTAIRFAKDTMSSYSSIYSSGFEQAFEEWMTGKNEHSPHHIPVDQVNIDEREERRALLREKYAHVSDFSFRLFFHNRLTDSVIIEEHLMAKKN